jgi:hypothetical protein
MRSLGFWKYEKFASSVGDVVQGILSLKLYWKNVAWENHEETREESSELEV